MAPRKPLFPVHPFDARFGTETSGLLPGTSIAAGTGFAPEDLTAYYGVAPSIFRQLVELWRDECAPRRPLEDTVFLDVGAGKGRAMLLASQYPFLRVEGVELNADLAAVARQNIAAWEGNPLSQAAAPIVLHEADATRHPLPAEPTLAYLFHPFEDKLLRRFVRHVQRSLQQNPRPFDLLYVNAEHAPLLDRSQGLERLWIGRISMSPEDQVADQAAIAQQNVYGSSGDEVCAVYRTIVK